MAAEGLTGESTRDETNPFVHFEAEASAALVFARNCRRIRKVKTAGKPLTGRCLHAKQVPYLLFKRIVEY